MLIDEVRVLLDQYAQWVRDKSVRREVNDQYVEITTPNLDRRNDYTLIYVRKDDGGFVLTDGGDTIQDCGRQAAIWKRRSAGNFSPRR